MVHLSKMVFKKKKQLASLVDNKTLSPAKTHGENSHGIELIELMTNFAIAIVIVIQDLLRFFLTPKCEHGTIAVLVNLVPKELRTASRPLVP
jgi:hypothetical protein